MRSRTEMNNAHPEPDRKKDTVCRCSGTTTMQIKRFVEQGIVDLESISRASGACSGCGACDSDILALIAEYQSLARNV
jgi:bacterioferritin-associated ferredoxin